MNSETKAFNCTIEELKHFSVKELADLLGTFNCTIEELKR